jgi:hypothetical protein
VLDMPLSTLIYISSVDILLNNVYMLPFLQFQNHLYRDLATVDLLLGLKTLTKMSCGSTLQGEQERITLGEKG